MEFRRYFTTIDAHVGGEALRIITGGLPLMKGNTVGEWKKYFQHDYDSVRKVLMQEPRGHLGMNGCVITPPFSRDADFGVLFMHNDGYIPICGYGIIAAVTVAIETRWIIEREPPHSGIVIDSLAGKIAAFAEFREKDVQAVSYVNVPSFVWKSDYPVTLDGKTVLADIAFGGAFYAMVNADDLGLNLVVHDLPLLQRWGKRIKQFIESNLDVQHPSGKDFQGLAGVIFSGRPQKPDSHLRSVTIFANGQIARSPCGTVTSAKMASLFKRGQLALNKDFVHESITGSQFTGRITEWSNAGSEVTVVTRIKGRAFITGIHQFFVDPSDPLQQGFVLR